MTRKLKTIPWIRVGLEGHSDSQYVDAKLAQGLLEALEEVLGLLMHGEELPGVKGYETVPLRVSWDRIKAGRRAILSATEEE